MSFERLRLAPRLLEAVAALGYTSPTPIQREAIPLALDGRDVVGCAQTGTGKTVAFLLPMLQRMPAGGGAPRALVVTPTRELALQIEGVARDLARFTEHRVAVVYGGVGYTPQVQALRRGLDLLIGTPGRLLDLGEKGVLDLGRVEILVLDEADRMLDMGFWPQVRRIVAQVPRRRQNLLFSATLSADVLRVIGSTLNDPAHVNVAPPATPVEKVAQRVYPVGGEQKADLLVRLIEEQRLERVLVFTRTKHRANRVSRVLLRSGIRSVAIHGNRSQSQRQNALEGFKSGRHQVLVATDIVSRGIDVEGISHVVNFDIPHSPEDYVHRIGRTARAGRAGTAFSLLSPEEHDALRQIERRLGTRLERSSLEGFEPTRGQRAPAAESSPTPSPRSARKPHHTHSARSSRRASRGRRRARRAPGWASA